MTILVTGASGFVGGWVMQLGGDRVYGLGRRPRSGRYLQCDLSLLEPTDDLQVTPTAVIHCAALSTPFASDEQFHRHNVEATARLIAWCERNGRPRLVHVSSSSVLYRDGDQLGLTEDSPVGPPFTNSYARTKAEAEQVVSGYAGPWVIARPRAVFGPGDTVLFPRVLSAARAGRLPRLTGRDTPAVGDLIYVENLADRLLSLADRDDLTGVYHLTEGQPVELTALIDDLLVRLGYPVPTRTMGIATAMRIAGLLEWLWKLLHLTGEPPITRYGVGVLSWSKTFDPSKMLADLGESKIPLAVGIDRFVSWQKEHQ